jgi:flagellum-specific peptidoglycan hydrolase FlgJ
LLHGLLTLLARKIIGIRADTPFVSLTSRGDHRDLEKMYGRSPFLSGSAYFALPVIGALALVPTVFGGPPDSIQVSSPATTVESLVGVQPTEPSTSPAEADESAPWATTQETFTHTIRPGDTVNKLAVRYGLQADTIVRANRLANPNRVLPGQQLIIPSDDSYTSSTAPSAGITAAAVSGSREATFIDSVAAGAQASQRVTGVPSSVTIAQAILETSWGSSRLAREANNYFGIKAYARPGPAGVVWFDAWEVENGKNVTRPEPFRKYHNSEESLVEHGRFFIENPRYRHALQATDDPREFARRINAAGYATDPAYSVKLISYMDRYDLYRFDLK